MDCCGNTFRKARTSLATIAETFRLWPMHSTTGPARHSGGEHRRKCLLTNYTRGRDTVLRRLVESALHAVVGVDDTTALRIAVCDGHPQRIGDQRCGLAGVDQPAD